MSPIRQLPYNLVPVRDGELAIGHRPRIKHLPQLRESGFTHVVTILSEKEGASKLGADIRASGLTWVWHDWGTAAPPEDQKTIAEFRRCYGLIRQALSERARVYVHCSAGIHRTGTFVYGLLLHVGHNTEEARETLRSLRPETFHQIGEDRLHWAESLA